MIEEKKIITLEEDDLENIAVRINSIKEEYETLNNKLQELNEEELNEVIGGAGHMAKGLCDDCNQDPNMCITKKINGFCLKESQSKM